MTETDFKVGDFVAVNDPKWWRHGHTGVITKVNKVTIAVAINGNSFDTVRGGKPYFVAVPASEMLVVPEGVVK